jgi:hypothetical protein
MGTKVIVPPDGDCTAFTGRLHRIDMVITAKHVCKLVELIFEDTNDFNRAKNNRQDFDNFFSEPYHRIIINKFGDPDAV